MLQAQQPQLSEVPTAVLMSELRRRGWRVTWAHDDDPQDGNLVAISPVVQLDGDRTAITAANHLDGGIDHLELVEDEVGNVVPIRTEREVH